MYRIMIVDDEMIARVGIKSLIPWNEYSFELAGEAENGQKALELARVLQPDIIITDMKMPVLNGIELIKELQKEGIKSKFVVLSSYDDFVFVKEAIKLGAEDYILKLEMEPEKLLEILKRAAHKIDIERSESNAKEKISRFYNENIKVLKERFVKDLILNNFSSAEEIEDKLDILNISLPQSNLICIVLRVNNEQMFIEYSEKDIEVLNSSIINILEEAVANCGVGHVCITKAWTFTAIISLRIMAEHLNKTVIDSTVERLVRNITELLDNTLNISVTVCVSRVFDAFSEAGDAYMQALQRLEMKQEECIEQNNEKVKIPLEDYLKQLEISFQQLDLEGIAKVFPAIKQSIMNASTVSKKNLSGIMHIIIFVVNNFLRNHGIEPYEVWGKETDPYKQVESLNTTKNYIDWISRVEKNIMSILATDKDSKAIIIKAKQFIKKNCSSEISLELVAAHFGLSANYFSRLFSKETGESFIDYLIKERIELAKEFLRNTNYKVYEISEKVGYDNQHYFSRIFKKVTGVSPLEFKGEVSFKRE